MHSELRLLDLESHTRELENRMREVHHYQDADVVVRSIKSYEDGTTLCSYRSVDMIVLWSSGGAIRW